MPQGTVSISIEELRVGVTCSHPIEDDNGVLLLGANTSITQQLINGLRDRGIEMIEVDPRDLAALRGKKSKPTPKTAAGKRDRAAADAEWEDAKPVKDMLIDRYDEELSPEREEKIKKCMVVAKERFDELKARLVQEKIRSLGSLNKIADDYARSMVDDHDHTLGVLGTPGPEDDLDQRSVKMAVLGMAVAIELGLDGPHTLEVGMTGLLHDIGLHSMDDKFKKPIELMSESERWEYRKHPLVSVLCVSDVVEVPPPVQLAMQQVHEHFDGSGYPRGVQGHRIHTYARILNVVDAYLQLTASTPTRSAIVPHDALGLMLHQAGHGIFDPKVIRAFLNVQTLFPLGSVVELSSGQIARVIRRPKSGFAAPVLEDLDGNRIELESTSLEIVRPVCDPDREQMRLTPEMMQASTWHPAVPSSVT